MSFELRDDLRWIRFVENDRVCPSCGGTHKGLFDIVCDRPIFWHADLQLDQDGEFKDEKNFLNADFCIVNREHFFIRCVLQLPIIGSDNAFFGYGVWSSLAKENFALYMESFDSGAQSQLGPWFGWFSNRLNGYPETVSLKCNVHPRDGRLRPLIKLEPTDHPLALEQAQGISFDRLLNIYAINGHDIRSALTTAH